MSLFSEILFNVINWTFLRLLVQLINLNKCIVKVIKKGDKSLFTTDVSDEQCFNFKIAQKTKSVQC